MVRVRATEADFEEAMARNHLGGRETWRKLKRQAIEIAADRLIQENHRRVQEVLERMNGTKDPATTLALHDEISQLFAENDHLTKVAFPSKHKEAAETKETQ